MKHGNLKSLVLEETRELLEQLLLDIQSHHPQFKKSLIRDRERLKSRFDQEGLGFATVALPNLAKALYQGLETGTLRAPSGFKCMKGTMIPRFLGGLLTQVFELDGALKDEPDESAVADVVQVSTFCYKLELPYPPKKREKVISDFKQTEADLANLNLDLADPTILEDARNLASRILKGFNTRDITPRHGPGAVATGEKNGEKWDFKVRYRNINMVYPYNRYFVASKRSLGKQLKKLRTLEKRDTGCAKVVLVPKDSRGPRLISMEPLEYQFIQQGIARSLTKHLESKSCITRGRVNFTDQKINRRLASANSLTREYATLDLKEASDRVSLELVERIFANERDFLNAIRATRTTHTKLPNGEIIPLRKFAPMGSALCFPVEALVFYILAEIVRRRERISGSIYVYGDDLIVPTKIVQALFDFIPTFGLKFNEGKCFAQGHFRESCGLDAYKGNLCTPVRMRKLLPFRSEDANGLVSAVALSNRLYERGYWKAARYVEQRVKSLINVDVLISPRETFGGLAFTSFTVKGKLIGEKTRCKFYSDREVREESKPIHPISQGYLIKAYQPRFRSTLYETDGHGRLFANLVSQRQDRIVVPYATQLKLRWIPFYF